MNERPLIRQLRAEDEAEWRALWRAYLDFYETELPDSIYTDTFARLLSGEPGAPRGLIAGFGGRPVGLVHFLFHAHCWNPRGVCYLQDLYAAPHVRGTGVGRALIEAVYAAADNAGVESVYWVTQEFNHVARSLYDRIGVKTPFIKYVRA